jgi:hypothetical protein
MDESDAPCGCVAIGLRGAAKRGVRLSEGKPGDEARGDTATLTHAHGHFDIDGPSFRLSEAPQAGGLFSIHMLLTQHLGIGALLSSSARIWHLRHDLRSAHAARGPRAPSVQGRASPYMFMHKLPCCACFYYVALSRIVY